MSTRLENERPYDVRVLERNVRKGVITRKDVEKYLKSLPDRSDNVAAADTAARDDDAASGGDHQSAPALPDAD